MKALVIIPSVRANANFGKYAEDFANHNHNPDILVIDEKAVHRKEIAAQFNRFGDFSLEFFGETERKAWFAERNLGDSDDIIPKQAHNETSFGFLVAATRNYEMVVTVDDDTFPLKNDDFLGEHWQALNQDLPVRFCSNRQWVNTHPTYFARGYPYNQRDSNYRTYQVHNEKRVSVLNMGQWLGTPDLNAIDYITLKPGDSPYSLDGDCSVVFNYVIEKGQFAPICSMNVAFKPEIIPAYYQLWHRDRFDDIFSGLFLKKIADHLRAGVSFGGPLVYHDKQERNLFKDAIAELPAIWLNENLWMKLNGIRLTKTTWLDCYQELAFELTSRFRESIFEDYIWVMTRKMLLWTSIVERVVG